MAGLPLFARGVFRGIAPKLTFAHFCSATKVGRAGARNIPIHGPFVSGLSAAASRRLASDTGLRAKSFRQDEKKMGGGPVPPPLRPGGIPGMVAAEKVTHHRGGGTPSSPGRGCRCPPKKMGAVPSSPATRGNLPLPGGKKEPGPVGPSPAPRGRGEARRPSPAPTSSR